MQIFIILLVIAGIVICLIKAGINKACQEDNSRNNRQQVAQQEDKPQRLECPGNGYTYYELVGMKFRKLTRNDIGIFDGYAFAEDDNEYDEYAVGIYRTDNSKLLAYVPKDFRGKSNKDLHEAIKKLGGSTHARFQIKEGSTGTLYGSAYIKA